MEVTTTLQKESHRTRVVSLSSSGTGTAYDDAYPNYESEKPAKSKATYDDELQLASVDHKDTKESSKAFIDGQAGKNGSDEYTQDEESSAQNMKTRRFVYVTKRPRVAS